ncbi:MAG: putative rep protein [Circular genetic element sp.]|nr:MAG: putative rep protein [Circular genetic element sp.]
MMARAGGCFAPSEENRTVFLTGTIPGGTSEAFKAVADWSSWIVHQLQREIPELIGERAANLKSMWVWEFQRRGALHWHGVYECANPEQARTLIAGFRAIWIKALRGVAARSGVDIAKRSAKGTWAERPSVWRIDAQLAIKDPSRYLAKYLSKDPGKGGRADIAYPTRWYQCSRLLLAELRRSIVSFYTNGPKGQGGAEVSSEDLIRLSKLQDLCDYAVAFGSRYNLGVTMVFYPPKQDRAKIMELFEGCTFSDFLSKVEENRALEQRTQISFRAVKYRSIDECLSRNYLAERLFNDIGNYYRDGLTAYVNGDTIDPEDMYWIDQAAGQILYRQGIFVSQSEAPPLRGLAKQMPEDGTSGGCPSQVAFDLDIPF